MTTEETGTGQQVARLLDCCMMMMMMMMMIGSGSGLFTVTVMILPESLLTSLTTIGFLVKTLLLEIKYNKILRVRGVLYA
jgi:hypothetical protein